MKLQQVANDVTPRVNDVALRANGFFSSLLHSPPKYVIIYLTQASNDRKSVVYIKNAIKNFFEFIFAILIATVFGICLIFILPFDYVKYKRSLYYKDTGRKYKPFAASGANFILCNEIAEHGLPIKFIEDPNDRSVEHGWFVFEKTLIIANVFDFEYDPLARKWVYSVEDGDEKRTLLSIDELLSSDIDEINRALKGNVCDSAAVLICADNIENAEKAGIEDGFLVYRGDRIERLKEFCESRA